MNLKRYFERIPLIHAFELILSRFFKKLQSRNSELSFSPMGEDMIISHLLHNKKGFFVDIGCNHPVYMNNTFRNYINGWNGINIDANEHLISLCNKIRRKDINIFAAISPTEQELSYYRFNDPAVNTLDPNLAEKHKKVWKFIDEIKIKTRNINSILKEHLPKNTTIDLLCVDIEGMDYEVLESIDYNTYKPSLIVVEMYDNHVNQALISPICNLLQSKGYIMKAFAGLNGYFMVK